MFDCTQIPALTELYRHFDADGNLLYVGISYHSFNRYQSHRKDSLWWKSAVRMTIERFASREDAELAERAAILNEHPKYNKRHSLTSSEREQIALPVEFPVSTKSRPWLVTPPPKRVYQERFVKVSDIEAIKEPHSLWLIRCVGIGQFVNDTFTEIMDRAKNGHCDKIVIWGGLWGGRKLLQALATETKPNEPCICIGILRDVEEAS